MTKEVANMIHINHIHHVPSAPNEDEVQVTLSSPSSGSELAGPLIEVRGEVIGHSGKLVAIEILHHGRLLKRMTRFRPKVERDDESSATGRGESSGFAGFVSVLGLPQRFRLDLEVVLRADTRRLVISIEGHRRPLQSGFRTDLGPLMLMSLGRTGTTFLMSLLSRHPEIVATRRYPYECHTAKFWIQNLLLLTRPVISSENGSSEFPQNRYFDLELMRNSIGVDAVFSDHVAAMCQESIQRWYQALAKAQGKSDVRYFTEKFVPNEIPPLVRELYPNTKEVFLVRDFRDMVCSILAFDKKRGYRGFGRFVGEETEDYVKRLATSAQSLLKAWERPDTEAHLVQYEQLVADPKDTLCGVCRFLGVDDGPRTITDIVNGAENDGRSFDTHRTSPSTSDSVARWQRDLDSHLQAVVTTAFEKPLIGFGYSLDGPLSGDGEALEGSRDAEPFTSGRRTS